jgi:UDP-glucose 4-epimerase
MSEGHFVDRRVLVTGGAGFIGSHLVEELVRQSALVTVVDNLRSGHIENLSDCKDRIEFVKCDVLSESFLGILAGSEFDIIYHLAGNPYIPPSVERPAFDYEANLLSTFRILECMRQNQLQAALIYVSSGAVYGNPVILPIDETTLTAPLCPYGVSKLAVERYLDVFCGLYSLRGASARVFSTFGPRQTKQIVYDLLQKLGDDPDRLDMLGDGSQTRDFNYVTNVVDALILVAEKGDLKGEVYNVASGRECSVKKLAAMICSQLGMSPEFVFSGSIRPGDAEKWRVSTDKLVRLGYRTRISLEEGIAKTIEWYRSRTAD